jgi:hypothetical protein
MGIELGGEAGITALIEGEYISIEYEYLTTKASSDPTLFLWYSSPLASLPKSALPM